MEQKDRRAILKRSGAAVAGAVTTALAGCVTSEDSGDDRESTTTGTGSMSSESPATTNSTAESKETNETSSETDDQGQSQLSIEAITLEDQPTCRDPVVEFDPGRVTVLGCVVGPNGCHEPVVKRTSVDNATIELAVESVNTSPEATACTSVITENGYRVTLQTAGPPAETVIVIHDDRSGQRTVTTAER